MVEPSGRQAVARLVSAALAVGPISACLPRPIRVVPTTRCGAASPALSDEQWTVTAGLLARVCDRAGVPGLTLTRATPLDQLGVFEQVVSRRLALAELAGELPGELPPGDVDRIATATIDAGFDAAFDKQRATSRDGLPLTVYHAGSGAEAVVLVPACGMPALLAEGWLRFLARDFHVLTWDSRGLFGPLGHDSHFTVDTEVQADDLFCVMDHFGIRTAHVVGLCGGAVIGLAAAAARPERVESLSLWHGAYELASGSPRTKFQNDLIELMTIAATSRSAADSVQAAFCQITLTNTPVELSHLVLYPYTSAELFYRYCRLNGALARTDVEPLLAGVTQPTLVVTSHDDATAHPQGSRLVAGALSNATLRVEPHGDHTSLFLADDDLLEVAADFIRLQRS